MLQFNRRLSRLKDVVGIVLLIQWEYDFLAEYRSGGSASVFVDEARQYIKEKLLRLKTDDLQILLRINQVTAVRLSQYCMTVHKIVS
jgi:hypothetical protein